MDMGIHLILWKSTRQHPCSILSSIHLNNSILPLLIPSNVNGRLKKRDLRPRMVVAEKNGGRGENAQGKSSSRPRGFWTNLWVKQEEPTKVRENKKPNVFWDSFASGNGGDLQEIGPIEIGFRDLFDPKPPNMLAVGFTALLSWATLQIFWQLFFVSLAIIIAALKYSLIAAILLFILVTLL